jgi:arylsulfatase A-like enzyme
MSFSTLTGNPRSKSVPPVRDHRPRSGYAAISRCAALLLTVQICWSRVSAAGAEAPGNRSTNANVLLIVVDDLGYGELGCQGSIEIPTPHIDSLAAGGVRCTAGYVTASFCSASRAGLLTGRYQTRFGHEFNPTGDGCLDPRSGLPLSERTLAEVLQAAGYTTGLVGKWHLGGRADFHPQRRGFDEFYGFLHEGHFYVPPPYRGVLSFLRIKELQGTSNLWQDGNTIWSARLKTNEPPYDSENPLLRGREPVDEQAYLTDAISREAVSFIERHGDRPFFLYLAYNAVHSPMQATYEKYEQFAGIKDHHRRIFAGMLSSLDDGVGRVLQELRQAGLDERTLVIFLSDNGGPTAELTSSNRPLRGGKGDLYEGGVRVPFLVRWTGRLPAGRTYEQPVLATDVFATACAAAGIDVPGDRVLDSVDLVPHLSGRRDGPPHETLYWRMGRKAALRHGNWKLVRPPVRPREEPRWELYALAADLGETDDLAETHPERLQELVGLWQQIDAEMAEPAWRPPRR